MTEFEDKKHDFCPCKEKGKKERVLESTSLLELGLLSFCMADLCKAPNCWSSLKTFHNGGQMHPLSCALQRPRSEDPLFSPSQRSRQNIRSCHDNDDGNSYSTGMSHFNFTLPEEALNSFSRASSLYCTELLHKWPVWCAVIGGFSLILSSWKCTENNAGYNSNLRFILMCSL